MAQARDSKRTRWVRHRQACCQTADEDVCRSRNRTYRKRWATQEYYGSGTRLKTHALGAAPALLCNHFSSPRHRFSNPPVGWATDYGQPMAPLQIRGNNFIGQHVCSKYRWPDALDVTLRVVRPRRSGTGLRKTWRSRHANEIITTTPTAGATCWHVVMFVFGEGIF